MRNLKNNLPKTPSSKKATLKLHLPTVAALQSLPKTEQYQQISQQSKLESFNIT